VDFPDEVSNSKRKIKDRKAAAKHKRNWNYHRKIWTGLKERFPNGTRGQSYYQKITARSGKKRVYSGE